MIGELSEIGHHLENKVIYKKIEEIIQQVNLQKKSKKNERPSVNDCMITA